MGKPDPMGAAAKNVGEGFEESDGKRSAPVRNKRKGRSSGRRSR